jgi:protein tyrosine phosphatase
MVKAAQRGPEDGPIIVHCSAGIGRSGTFCAVHSTVKMMNEYVSKHGAMPPINIVETVLVLRDQRPGMVQTKEQFMFCYLAVQEEYLKLRDSLQKKKKRKESKAAAASDEADE